MKRVEVLEQIKKAISSIAPTAKTILFGSEARGDARPDSDIDFISPFAHLDDNRWLKLFAETCFHPSEDNILRVT